MEHNIAVVGTPDDAIRRIERLYEKQGEFGCLLLQISNWADWPALKRSVELYAQYVIPHFAAPTATGSTRTAGSPKIRTSWSPNASTRPSR